MIKYCYSYFNRLTGQYEMPRAVPFDKEAAVESLMDYLKTTIQEDNKELLECDFYFCGKFDTKTGIFTQEKELLLSLSKESIYGG